MTRREFPPFNLDDVPDGIKELERAARPGPAGAMITEYPAEDRRYDQPEYEPFWAAGIRLRDVIGPDNMIWDNMMWGSDYPHSESTFPQSRKILAEILEGVPDDERSGDRRRQHRPRLQF